MMKKKKTASPKTKEMKTMTLKKPEPQAGKLSPQQIKKPSRGDEQRRKRFKRK